MKKILSLVLAVIMLLGCCVPAFATEVATPTNQSGTTTITATKAEPFSYEIVIPTDVAEITAAGVYQVGQAKVTNVISATDNTVISYTATTTDFKLTTDTSKTMAATYYTEQAANNAFPTTAVTVYKNKADAASIPTMWVKIAESVWEAAEAGTYKATVTYNFSTEETPAIVTIGDVLATVDGGFPTDKDSAWKNGDCYCMCLNDSGVDKLVFYNATERVTSFNLLDEITAANECYEYDDGMECLTFKMTGNKLTSIVAQFGGAVEGENGTYHVVK